MSDHDAVEQSDILDEQIAETLRSFPGRRAMGIVAFTTMIIVSLVGIAILLMFLELRHLSSSNNRLLEKQIPALQDGIDRRDEQIANLKAENKAYIYVLNKQAVPAIIYYSQLLQDAGVTPPRVLLTPDKPPFKPPIGRGNP